MTDVVTLSREIGQRTGGFCALRSSDHVGITSRSIAQNPGSLGESEGSRPCRPLFEFVFDRGAPCLQGSGPPTHPWSLTARCARAYPDAGTNADAPHEWNVLCVSPWGVEMFPPWAMLLNYPPLGR